MFENKFYRYRHEVVPEKRNLELYKPSTFSKKHEKKEIGAIVRSAQHPNAGQKTLIGNTKWNISAVFLCLSP